MERADGSFRVARDSPRAPLQRGGGRVCASRTRTLGGTNRPSRCSSTGYTPRCLPRRIERTSNPEDLGTNGWNEKRELTTVVLIHGLWMTPLSWEHWVARYQRQGLRVIAPGYPGIEPGLGQGRAQIQNQQERTALKPAKASAVAGSGAFRGVFWICRHLDRGAALLQPKVAALKHVSKPRASGRWSREMCYWGSFPFC